jgi:hypothetical protein
MKMGEGRDGGISAIGIAPIPSFPRRRGKGLTVAHEQCRIQLVVALLGGFAQRRQQLRLVLRHQAIRQL